MSFAKKAILLCLAVCVAAGMPERARADESENIAVLRCDPARNVFVVRFARSWNDGPSEQDAFVDINDDVEKNWLASSPAPSGTCDLPGGLKISVKTETGQTFAYGRGGADPTVFLYLTVNDKPAYYRQTFYKGYGSEAYTMSAVVYRNGTLFECPARAEGDSPVPSPCADASARLAGTTLTPQELDALKDDQERAKLEAALPSACARLRDSVIFDDTRATRDLGIGMLSEYAIDLDNDGKTDRVFRLGGGSSDCASCGNHYFDGSFLIAFPKGEKGADHFIEFLSLQDDGRLDVEKIGDLKELSESHGTLFSGGQEGSSIRYVYNVPFVAAGTTYVYSFETNREAVPAAVISKLTPDRKTETVCRFATPEER